jgi:hypothetical protein
MPRVTHALRDVTALPMQSLRFYGAIVRQAWNLELEMGPSMFLGGLLVALAVVIYKLLDMFNRTVHGGWHIIATALLTAAALWLTLTKAYFIVSASGD